MTEHYEVRITEHAEEAMHVIARYIAFELLDPQAAMNLLYDLRDRIRKLSEMPQRIKPINEEPWGSEGIRKVPVHNYYVYFWIDEDNHLVQVTDVIYHGRDQKDQLKNMPLQ